MRLGSYLVFDFDDLLLIANRDNQMNFALFHCLGPSIQTALLNAPLVVLVGWGLDKSMDLNFEIFMVVILILSILVVGNFLRDGKSNYLEGALLVMVYVSTPSSKPALGTD
jgi:Ca2+:H+ antiporter